MAIAVLNLFGWATGSTLLVSFASGLPDMVPMTAALVLLLNVAILRQLPGADGRLPAIAVVAAACLVLLWHLAAGFGLDLAPPGASSPARPSSPLTAILFLVLGGALLCNLHARLMHLAQWLAISVFLVALLILAGYALRGTFLYHLLPAQGTSILTTFSLLLSAFAVLLMHPGQGVMVAISGARPSAWAARRLLAAALAVPVLLGSICGVVLHLGWVDSGTALTLMVWGMGILFATTICYCALQLHQIDVARLAAEHAREDALARLRAADANKDEFIALIAHELRNPLAPIRSAADLLRFSSALDAGLLQRTSEVIARQVDHMTHMVDDLLDMSRVSQGLLSLDKQAVDMAGVVEDALVQIRPQMAQRRQVLEVGVAAGRPLVCGDHKRLVQILANVLNNAVKYTPREGRIRLQLEADQMVVRVTIEDTGIGIAAELLPHVFDTYAQADRRAGRAEGGIGIGLSLVRRLVELHHGAIMAESDGPGQGSRFTVTLPRLFSPQHAVHQGN